LNLRKNIFLRDVSILSLGTLIAQIINLGSIFLLSRIYGVEAFGTLALFMAYGSIIFSFSTLKLDLAIVKTKVLKEKLALIQLSFFSIFTISILISIGLFIWSFWNMKLNQSFIFSLFIFCIVNGGNQVLVYFFNSEKEYSNITFAKILLALANLVFAFLFIYWSPNQGLIWALILANFCSFFLLLLFFGKKINAIFKIDQSILKQGLNKNNKFIRFTTPASFLDTLSYQVIFIFLSEYFSESITGSFFMAMRVVYLPLTLIGSAISQVFYKDISDKISNNNLSTIDFFKIWKLLAKLGIVPFLILYFFGKDLFSFLLGENWILAGEMAAVLAIVGFFTFLSSPTSSGFVVMNQQKYNLLNSSIRLTYTLLFLVWSARKGDIFFFLWSYTFAELMMMVLYNVVMLNLLKRVNREVKRIE